MQSLVSDDECGVVGVDAWIEPDAKNHSKCSCPELCRPASKAIISELLLGYMNYLKQRQFEQFWIWVMAPSERDNDDPMADYMFNYRPSFQWVPDQQQLEKWYVKLADTAKEREIIVEYSDNRAGEKRKAEFAFRGKVEESSGGGKRGKRNNVSLQNVPLFNGDNLAIQVDYVLEQEQGLGSRTKSVAVVRKVQERIQQHNMGSYIVCHFGQESAMGAASLLTDDKPHTLHNGLNDRKKIYDLMTQNRYQFNTLRHARHSTMMLLYYFYDCRRLKTVTKRSRRRDPNRLVGSEQVTCLLPVCSMAL